MLNLLIPFFVEQCSEIANASKLPSDIFNLTDKSLSNIHITGDLILKIIRKLDINKTHDHDNISIPMLKICDEPICIPLEIILKNCLTQELFFQMNEKS